MSESLSLHKITLQHRSLKAIVYVRQSSPKQVAENLESQRLQYAIVERAKALGFPQVETIDCDLGKSASVGAAERRGFDTVISSVAKGEVGIVLSREVSRLSRTDKDWCQLMEVCQIFNTLIGDEEHVYDLNLLDDQLVLGIKGTMSVVELKVLQMRMLRGQEEKARRGELLKRLAVGYERGGQAPVAITADERVHDAIAMVFKKFREVRTIRQTFQWFRDHDVELPVNPAGGGNELVWQIPTQAFVRDVLVNPFYAGAYVWGRRPIETKLVDGQLKKRQGRLRRPYECRVFIPDHHDGYIEWTTYEENQEIIRGNNMNLETSESMAAVRKGSGLLTGLLRCGHCGRKLHVRYWGGRGTNARYLCKGDFDSGGEYCLGFGGDRVDRRVAEEVLKVISPLGIEASLQAVDRLTHGDHDRRQLFEQQLQQLQFDAQRAFEQYNEVDPRNRLVAAELERRWNAKLEEVEQAKAALSLLDHQRPTLTAADEERIRALGENFADVWNSKDCPGTLKKQMARTIIEEVIASDADEHTLRFVIHWKGGVHTELMLPRPKSATAQQSSLESLEIIRKMAVRYGDDQIASVLNRLGHRTGKGLRWNQTRVKTARRNHGIAGQKRALPNPEFLSLTAAARYCGVSNKSIERLVERGILPMQQVVPRAPWEIRRADLDAAPVKNILGRLRRTGRLIIEGGDSAGQRQLFPVNQGDDNAGYHE
ncbi:MAG: recombinase family protein [Candidatus Acidiferrales bacterium]